MVWYAALATTTGSGVVVDTTMKVNVQMAVWGVQYFGCKLEYNWARWWVKTNFHSQLVPRECVGLGGQRRYPQTPAVGNIKC